MNLARGVIAGALLLVLVGCTSAGSGTVSSTVGALASNPLSEQVPSPSASDPSPSASRSGATAAPTSFAAASPVPAMVQTDGTALTTAVQRFAVSADLYAVVYSDSADQLHVAGVSTTTGEVRWQTEAMGPKMNPQTGQRSTCAALDEFTLSCPKSTIDVRSGDVTAHESSVVGSVPRGFVGSTYKDATNFIQLINKDDGSVIWEYAGAIFAELLDDDHVLAIIAGGRDITKTLVLDTATGKPTTEYSGDVFPSGDVWLRVTEKDATSGPAASTTDRIDPATGEVLWSSSGVAMSGNWQLAERNGWNIDPAVPAPLVVRTAPGLQPTATDVLYHVIDPETGADLWSCTNQTCGGERIFGYTPERLVTATTLLDRATGNSIAEWGGTYGQLEVLTSNYAVAYDDDKKLTEALSLDDGLLIWSAPGDGSAIEAGVCFLAFTGSTQTIVCPSE